MEGDGTDATDGAKRERDGLNLSFGMLVEILMSKGMSLNDISEMTFDQVNLIVGKHFERQTFYFKSAVDALFGSSKSNTSFGQGKQAALQGVKPSTHSTGNVDVTPVKDNPYPDGFGKPETVG